MSIQQFISKVSLFALMDEEERSALAEKMDGRCLHPGEKIFSQGDAGDSLILIQNGRVQIYVEKADKAKIIVGELQTGEVVGEVSLFDPGPRTATAVAMEHTDVLIFDHEDLWQVLQHRPHMAIDMLAVLGKRLRSTDELLRHQATRNVNVRDRETLTFAERLAESAASLFGSWPFALGVNVAMLIWLVWLATNLNFARQFTEEYRVLLITLVFAALAALQSSVILMAQRRDAKHNRLRGDLEYDVNLKTELELAELNHKIERICGAMNINIKPDGPPRSESHGAGS